MTSILTGLKVRDAMRRQVICLSEDDAVKKAISHLIKFKVNAVLVVDPRATPIGVVSKTDIMAAYYASLPMETPLRDIMASPPILCEEYDNLESIMEKMREKRIYRIYVKERSFQGVSGLLAYPDIVGLVYRFCRNCRHNYLVRGKNEGEKGGVRQFTVREVMTDRVEHFSQNDSLYQVMEGLSRYRFGAVLIKNDTGGAVGVISKTDLILAYTHGISPETKAEDIMSRRVCSCLKEAYLAEAIHQMIFSDVHRLFIYDKQPDQIVGVLSFTDAARMRSGSCQACLTSRIKIDTEAT